MLEPHKRELQAAVSAHRAGRLDIAQKIYGALFNLYPSNFDVVHLLGLTYFQSGNLGRGAELIETALRLNSRSAAAHNNLGNIYKAQGRLREASVSFTTALELKPGFAEALANRGFVGRALGLTENSLSDYECALRVVPNYPEAHLGRGLALREMNRVEEAIQAFGAAISAKPDYAEALSNKGALLAEAGRAGEASQLLEAAARLRPDLPGSHYNLGNAYLAAARFAEALAAYDEALRIKPDYAEAWSNRGNALSELRRLDEAVASYDKAIGLRPGYAEAHSNRGNALKDMGALDSALASYDKAINLRPDYAEGYNNRGNCLKELRRLDEALASYETATALKPDYAEAWSNRGNALFELAKYDEALASHDRAIALKPDYAEAHSNRGNALKELQRFEDALASYDTAIALKPDYAEAFSNRGNALRELGRHSEALASYDRAIKLRPDYAEAYSSRANVLSEVKRLDEALKDYETAVRLKPGIDYLLGRRLSTKLTLCDWSEIDDALRALEQAIQSGEKAVSLWEAFGLYDRGDLHLAAARAGAAGRHASRGAVPAFHAGGGGGKIKVGYYSADFHNHATAYLMAEFLEEHDREAFEVYGFSYGPRIDDHMRRRVSAACHRFLDVSGQSDAEVAALSRELGIDIAVAINGYTNGARLGIFAGRCAPIQVNFLGHAGTMGVPYIDYIVADRVLIPEENRRHFTEKVAYLPGSYQPNDSGRKVLEPASTRREAGLPERGFVFCCFNNNYKIMPNVFDCWMRILRRVEGSVLWLLADNEGAARNLRAEAGRRGVDPERIIFARRLPNEEHLARQRLADLFLDTLPYNAHTTASDALWAGVPVLTCRGNSFAARVSASLLTALGMPELITGDLRGYEDLAVTIATDPATCSDLRGKLWRNRLTSTLFSGRAFARGIERAFMGMIERRRGGLEPDHIFVEPAG